LSKRAKDLECDLPCNRDVNQEIRLKRTIISEIYVVSFLSRGIIAQNTQCIPQRLNLHTKHMIVL